MKKILKILSVNLLLIFIFLIILEFVTRVFSIGPDLTSQLNYHDFIEDESLPFVMKPNNCKKQFYGGDSIVFCTNSDNFRDVEYKVDKADSILRIVGLGASYAYGACVNLEDSYLGSTEHSLNNYLEIIDTNIRTQILKMGCATYFPEVEYELLVSKGVKYNPDFVVIEAMASHVASTYLGKDFISVTDDGYLKSNQADKIGSFGQWLYLNSRLSRYFLYRYLDSHKKKFIWSEIFKEDGFHEKDWIKMQNSYSKISQFCRENNIKVIMLFIPQMDISKGLNYTYLEKRFKIIAEKNNMSFVSTLGGFINYNNNNIEEVFYEKHMHPNPIGYKIIADSLTSFLKSKITN